VLAGGRHHSAAVGSGRGSQAVSLCWGVLVVIVCTCIFGCATLNVNTKLTTCTLTKCWCHFDMNNRNSSPLGCNLLTKRDLSFEQARLCSMLMHESKEDDDEAN
jgi:hypothetical protein